MEQELNELAARMADGDSDSALLSRYDRITASFEAAGGYDTV